MSAMENKAQCGAFILHSFIQ